MNLRLIVREVFRREIEGLLDSCADSVEVSNLRSALHNRPMELRVELQRQIDATQRGALMPHNRGTNWHSRGWIESDSPNRESVDQTGGESYQTARRAVQYKDYVARYGNDNARYFISEEARWKQNYARLVYIHQDFGNAEHYRRFARELSARDQWFEESPGDVRLPSVLLMGTWPVEGFYGPETGRVPTMCERTVG